MTEVKNRIVELNVEEIPIIEEEDKSMLKDETEKNEKRSIWDYFSHYPYISTIFFF